jgi:16S rRNA (cytosine967-C5)-methyltransferase
MNRRKTAHQLLSDWLTMSHHLDYQLDRYFDNHNNLDDQDKAWLSATLFGTVEKLLSLNGFLQQVSKGKFNKNKRRTKAALYLGAYELFYGREKNYATLNEYVALFAKGSFEKKLVNGILRELDRSREALQKEAAESTDVEMLYNIPQALHNLLSQEHEPETLLAWYKKLNTERPLLWVRRNRLHHSAGDLFFKAESFKAIKSDLLAGYCSVQNIAAGKVVEFLAPKAETTILDFCSAPGTKTSFIAELTADKAAITATDSDDFRLTKVVENAKRLGLSSIKTAPMAAVLASGEQYDQVLVDIPCSGLGTLGKRSDLVHHFSLEKLDELELLQRSILDTAKQFVRVGGELVLSTCTIVKRENQDLTDDFLAKNPQFSQVAEPLICLPFSGENDGAFAVKLKRNA